MSPQEWRELKVGDQVTHKDVTFRVDKVVLDADHDQAGVVFKSPNGEEIATIRAGRTFLIVPNDFVSEAKIVAKAT